MSLEVEPLRAPDRIFLEGLLQIADEGVVIHDSEGKIIYCNPAAERILGLSADRILGSVSASFEAATIREDGLPFSADEHPAMLTLRTGKPCTKVVMGLEWDPETPRKWVSINSAIIPSSAGEPVAVFAIFADITAHVEAKRQLREMAASLQQTNHALGTAETLMRSLLRAIPDHVWLKDPQGVYLFCNSALARTYNSTESEVIGKTDRDFSTAAQAALFQQQDREAARGDKPMVIVEDVSFLGNPARPALETVKVPMRDGAGRLIGVLGISRDITERRELEKQLMQTNAELKKLTVELESLARTDPLTALPNRRAFEAAIERNFRHFKRLGTRSSVLMVDIDRFKQVNDQYGHNAGDAALVFVAETIRAHCRIADMAARLGGEEFALLLPGTIGQDSFAVAERLRAAIQKTEITFGLNRFSLTISVGVSAYRHADAGWAEVLGRADAALYLAKASGRNKVRECGQGNAV